MNDTAKPLITTIIPTYRRPKLLRRSIRSVLNQTYPHFQVCVYDNASGDETASVVAELSKEDPRVKYHCHAENIGALRNFNYGMEHVNTPFFSFLSDDDILLPEFYGIALEGFEKYPDAVFSATSVIIVDTRQNIIDVQGLLWEPGLYQPPEGLLAMLKHYIPLWTSSLFRRDVIEKVGILDQKVGVPADLDFQFRTAAILPFIISIEPGAIFFVHPSSTTITSFHFTFPGWLKLISNLTENEQLSLDVRNYAKSTLVKNVKKYFFRHWRNAILQRNFEDAYKIVDSLQNNYHLKSKWFFYIFTIICQYFPPCYNFVVFIKKIRMLPRRIKYQHLKEKYSDFLSSYNGYTRT